MQTDEMWHDTENYIVNQSLEILECSPLNVLLSHRVLSIGKRKIKDVPTKFKNVASIALSKPQLTENSDRSNCWRLVDSTRRNLQIAPTRAKYKCLRLPQNIGQSNKHCSFSMSVNMQ